MPAEATLDMVQQRRAEIVDAAERCVKAQGLHQLKLRDVARESGKSLGNLYNYFQNKEAIVEALVERQTQAFLEMLRENESDKELDRDKRTRLCIERVVDAYLDPESVRISIFIASEALVNPRVREIKLKADQRLRNYLLEHIAGDMRENGAEPDLKLLTAQIAISRAFLEALRGTILFMPDLDREVLRKVVVDRLILMVQCDVASWRGIELESVIRETIGRGENPQLGSSAQIMQKSGPFGPLFCNWYGVLRKVVLRFCVKFPTVCMMRRARRTRPAP